MTGWFPELLGRLGATWDVAERFSAVCRAAGVEEVDQRVFVPTLRPEQASTDFSIYHDILAGIRPLLRHGIASEREIAGVLAALRAGQESAHNATIYSHLQAELVAHVPGGG
jgi:hypothetical protein